MKLCVFFLLFHSIVIDTIQMKIISYQEDNVLYMSFRRPFGSYLFSREVEGIDRILWTTTLTDSSAAGDQALVSIACQ